MPIIGADGRIGYFEWESKIDFEWLGIRRDKLVAPEDEDDEDDDLEDPYACKI